MKRDQRVDDYIARQADFARPILTHLREAVHGACTQAEEALKWSAPAFMYKGEILATMAAFKAHAAFNFWRGSLVVPETEAQRGAMGQFGRLTSIADLPEPETLATLVRKAMTLSDAGVRAPRDKTARPQAAVPDDLQAALEANRPAAEHFAAFSQSSRREYIDWIREAKRAETRAARLAQAIEWIAEGKKRNWRYEKC